MKFRLLPLLLLSSLAGAQGIPSSAEPVQMAPVTVKAGPMAFIGIRCSVTVGMFGFASNNARIKELLILEVLKDSAGQRAGLLAQDHILAIAGTPITDYTINSLKEIGDREKGDTIELEVRSPGANAPRMVRVTLGSRKMPTH